MRWFVEPACWIAGLIGLLLACFASIALAPGVFCGRELAAAVLYSSWMAILLFFPGRAHRAYNPFGAIVRRVWWPLLRLHWIALAVVVLAALLADLVSRHDPWRLAPRTLFAAWAIAALAISFPQYFRSIDLLTESEEVQRKRSAS